MAVYRPYFISLAVLSLAWTFYRAFRPKLMVARGKGIRAVLAALRPTQREAPVFLGAGLVILLVLFPYWGRPLFLG